MKTLEERFWSKVDKMRDMFSKGRNVSVGRPKLTDAQVFAIRVRAAMGDPTSVLAHDYGVGPRQIRKIVTGSQR